MPNWIWPKHSKIDPKAVVRLGRVLHWTFSGFASLMAFGVLIALFNPAGMSSKEANAMLAITLAFTVVTFLCGRGLRYIFSGE